MYRKACCKKRQIQTARRETPESVLYDEHVTDTMVARVSTQLYVLALLIFMMPTCQAFLPNFWSRVLTLSWDSYTHQYMTEKAILNVTIKTLRTMMEHQQETEEMDSGLGRGFWHAVREVSNANAAMDFLSSTRSDPIYHFDSERVKGAIEMLREFWGQTVQLTKSKEYQAARRSLGMLFHSLQDFYSHSNWVEMGQQDVYNHLLHPEEPAVPVASDNVPTCSECSGHSCYSNLLEEMTRKSEPLLTTGYFSSYPLKPPGKCSHGGVLDTSRYHGAEGGINKDSTSPLFSPHHYLHKEAVHLATTATLQALQDLRDEVGPKRFLRLFSVQQPPALVFVMDTTGSMFEEITAARLRALSIIQAREKTKQMHMPGTFVLVPFHDPGFGPVMETDDPYTFMQYMEELTALGGGDEPEMCLSALQLALTHSPPLSEVFVFTDASPKDRHLQSVVQALIQEKQIKVNFLLTEDPSFAGKARLRKRKRRETLSPDRFSIYSFLSSVSGGMTISTTNKDIHKVSTIVEDTTTSSKVTLLHADGEIGSNSFMVDKAVTKVILHATGQVTHCELVSPSGVYQSLPDAYGPLATMDSFQGFYRINLLSPLETGIWQLNIKSNGPVSFNVLGESNLDFLYYFASQANETHPGLRKIDGNPIAGIPLFLVVAVTGLSQNEKAIFNHVTFLGSNGENLQKVLLNYSSSHWSGEELVGHMESVPRVPFSLRLSGKDGNGNLLERVSSETIQPTHVQIQVLSAPLLLPDHRSAVVFEISNHGPDRHFSLFAEDDNGYLVRSNKHRNKLFISENRSLKREVEIWTPHAAQTGRTITLTITIQAEDSPDSNYAVVHLTVMPEEPDSSPPACSALRVESSCPSLCTEGDWKVSMVAKDRGHSGLASIQLERGEGILILSEMSTERSAVHSLQEESQEGVYLPLQQPQKGTTDSTELTNDQRAGIRAENRHPSQKQLVKGDPPLSLEKWSKGKPLMMLYSSNCCAPHAELLLLDKAGNMRRCHFFASQQRALRDSNWAHRTVAASSWLVLVLSLLLAWCCR